MRVRNGRRSGLVLIGVAACLLGACTSAGGSQPTQGNQAANKGGSGGVSNVGPQGRGANSSSDDPDAIVNAVLDDVEAYWKVNLQETYRVEFKTLAKGRHPYDSSTPPPPCGGTPFTYAQQKHNAYYCNLDDYIAWDREDLVPQLNAKYGKFAVGLVVAHEWGHGISNRGGVPLEVKTIVKEQQADCFAGAWTKWESEGNGANLKMERGDLQKGLAALLELRDPVGASDPNEQGAHGSAFDRINAFQEGFQQGPQRCADYLQNLPPLTEAKFSDDADAKSGGNAPYDSIAETTARDLNDYYASAAQKAGIDFKPVESVKGYTAPPSCGGKQLSEEEAKNNVFYCAADNYVGYDDRFMRNVYEAIGDFGVATLLAHQFAVAAQEQNQVDSGSNEAQLQQSCLTGSWAASLTPGSGNERQGPDSLRLSPGDLDEAIQAFLAFSEPPEHEGQLDSFERIKKLRSGYFDGERGCGT